MNFESMTNSELLISTDEAVSKEKEAIQLTTRHFQEIMHRRAYLPAYASLFDFLTLKHGYCAGSAQLRINALKLIRQVPAAQEKIESGALSMTAAANIQSFLNSEAKMDRPYSQNAKIELIESCLGKSTLEVRKEFVRRNPETEKREVVKPISDDRVRLEVNVPTKTLENLNRLTEILSHSCPSLSIADVLTQLAEEGLEKHCPHRAAKRAQNRKERSSLREFTSLSSERQAREDIKGDRTPTTSFHPHGTKTSRYIPAHERHEVPNDSGGCTFVDASTGRRCGSKRFLQLDHVEPFSQGGSHEASNLRWLCGAHNRWRAGQL